MATATVRRAGDTKQRLLDAAVEVVTDSGAEALTLEAVAARAGTSKGGLLYHFPTKEALVEGMVQAMLDRFELDIEHALVAGPDGPGAFARALVHVNFAVGHDAFDREARVAGLIAAVAGHRDLLARGIERYERIMAPLASDGLDAATAATVRVAVEGLFLGGMMGIAPPPTRLRRAIGERLLHLVDGATAEDARRQRTT